MKKRRCATITDDYKRHGTTTLFAANVPEGTVIADCMPRHRNQEFLLFLRWLDREFPAHLDFHLILDNCGTHKHPHVTQWLAKRPRFHLHFIPTSSSWLNLIERWFAKLTERSTTTILSPSFGPLQFNPSWKRSIVIKPFMQQNTSDCRGEKLPTRICPD